MTNFDAHRDWPSVRAANARSVLLRLLRGLAVFLFFSTSPSTQAGPGHVHGQAQLEVILDGQRLALTMQIPMEALVGFERAPRNEDERARLDNAFDRLRASTLFRPSPEAGCRAAPASLSWSSGGLTNLPPQDTHTDLTLALEFECDTPGRLASIEVNAFDAFSRLRRIEARIASPSGAYARTLQRAKRTLELRR